MKQTMPVKWIETAEARAVCELAEAEPGSFPVSPPEVAGPAARGVRLLRSLRRIWLRQPPETVAPDERCAGIDYSDAGFVDRRGDSRR